MKNIEQLKKASGKRIASIALGADGYDLDDWEPRSEIVFAFTDGTALVIHDHAQCCEDRYLHTDDTLKYYEGEALIGAEFVYVGKSKVSDFRVKETGFLRVMTSGGVITFNTYNKHNGYYTGFEFAAQFFEAAH